VHHLTKTALLFFHRDEAIKASCERLSENQEEGEVEREEDSDGPLQVLFFNDRYDHCVSDEELQYNIK